MSKNQSNTLFLKIFIVVVVILLLIIGYSYYTFKDKKDSISIYDNKEAYEYYKNKLGDLNGLSRVEINDLIYSVETFKGADFPISNFYYNEWFINIKNRREALRYFTSEQISNVTKKCEEYDRYQSIKDLNTRDKNNILFYIISLRGITCDKFTNWDLAK